LVYRRALGSWNWNRAYRREDGCFLCWTSSPLDSGSSAMPGGSGYVAGHSSSAINRCSGAARSDCRLFGSGTGAGSGRLPNTSAQVMTGLHPRRQGSAGLYAGLLDLIPTSPGRIQASIRSRKASFAHRQTSPAACHSTLARRETHLDNGRVQPKIERKDLPRARPPLARGRIHFASARNPLPKRKERLRCTRLAVGRVRLDYDLAGSTSNSTGFTRDLAGFTWYVAASSSKLPALTL
jgi:hypothetical protein